MVMVHQILDVCRGQGRREKIKGIGERGKGTPAVKTPFASFPPNDVHLIQITLTVNNCQFTCQLKPGTLQAEKTRLMVEEAGNDEKIVKYIMSVMQSPTPLIFSRLPRSPSPSPSPITSPRRLGRL